MHGPFKRMPGFLTISVLPGWMEFPLIFPVRCFGVPLPGTGALRKGSLCRAGSSHSSVKTSAANNSS